MSKIVFRYQVEDFMTFKDRPTDKHIIDKSPAHGSEPLKTQINLFTFSATQIDFLVIQTTKPEEYEESIRED